LRSFSARLPYFAVVGAIGIAVLAGAFYLFDRPAAEAPPPAPVRQVAGKSSADLSDSDTLRDEVSKDRAFHVIAQARRLADGGKFAEANAKLDAADRLVPGLSATAEARRRIAQLATPAGQFTLQIARARNAVGNDDYADADRTLAEAARLKPDSPEVAGLRQAMQAAQQNKAKRSSRVSELLAIMRDALARKDVAGADRAFNEASRIDVLDPALEQARVELAQAHDGLREQKD